MTILFAGGELGSFTPSDNTVIEATTGPPSNNPVFDPNYARCALTMALTPSDAISAPFVATNAIWLHANLNYTFPGSEETVLEVFSGATAVFKLTGQSVGGAAFYRMYYWTGAAFAQVGAGFSVPQFTLQTFDIQLSSGNIFCYVAGTTKDGAAGAFAAVTAMTSLEFLPANDETFISEVIVADQPTLGYRLRTLPVTGNGSTQQWTGDFTDIDEIVTNDGSFIATPTANELMLFEHSTVSKNSIRALVVTARAVTTPGAPQHLQLAVDSAATIGLSASIAQGAAFQPNVGIFPNDPATAAPWTNAAINACQYGVKSLA